MACDCQCWGCVSGDYHCDSVKCDHFRRKKTKRKKKQPKHRAGDPPKEGKS